MPRPRVVLIGLAGIAAAALAVPFTANVHAQLVAGLRANWADLETWTHPDDGARQDEVGLGLQPSGPAGVMFVAFTARLSRRERKQPPGAVAVQVGTPIMANPSIVRTSTLTFTIENAAGGHRVMNLGPRLRVDSSPDGAPIDNGIAELTPAEYQRLAGARTLAANVLGFDVTFRPDQLRAMRTFAARVRLAVADPDQASGAGSAGAPTAAGPASAGR
jgi:hypothetical protein